jgi:hypothetical protein
MMDGRSYPNFPKAKPVEPSDEKVIEAMGEIMAEVGQPCSDDFLLKLGRDFLKAVS